VATLSALITPDAILAIEAPIVQDILACQLLKQLRQMIPDPTQDPVTGLQDQVISCEHDGFRFTNATLLDWLSDGLTEVVKYTNWRVEDWFAFAAQAKQPIYQLDLRWHQILAVYAYQRQCFPFPQQYTIYPAQAVGQPLTYGTHRRVGALELSYWPNPDLGDPRTALASSIGPDSEVIDLLSTEGFLPFGWVKIDGELIQYQQVEGTRLSVSRRGCAGTLKEPHVAFAPARSCSLWVKGKRIPSTLTTPQSVVEVPPAFMVPIRTYARAQVKGAEQDDQAEGQLMQRFWQECERILVDSALQSDLQDGTAQVSMYGQYPNGGPLYPLGPFGTIVG
jgi:hypothetical protein